MNRGDLVNFLNDIILPVLSNQNSQILDTPISKEEFQLVLTQVRQCKAPGPDGFPAEFFSSCQEMLLTPLFEALPDVALGNVHMPGMSDSMILLVLKEGKDYPLTRFV